ncbi:uncharacterized protein LOC128128001 [Lactuca sativa]|uniref:uncharacterized protein LOC128128001 n=1 Tax=Lactuca sativa TaxID=4236 RepID=UPI0022AF65E1|nr:uncharacterized protein LOC128128001 [Lactuca sativa]
MDHLKYANIENEIEVDDSDDDLGNVDDVLFEEQLEEPKIEKETCSTSLLDHAFARTHSYAPLTCTSWHKVPHKDKIWEYVLGKYDVPDDAKTWVLRTIGNLYKVYKCRFKKKHFYQFKDNKTRWKNRPECIPQEEFSKLLVLWNKKDVAERCSRAKEIRKSLKNMHTAGPKSFARIRDEMKNEDPNKKFPTLSQMFERTRKRTDGHEQMKKYEHLEDDSDVIDPYMIVMKKENDGYRLGGGDASYMIPTGLMESFKANEVKRNELMEMRKEIQEDHEKKQAGLEAMQIDIKKQQENLEAMMRKLAEQQPREG